MPDPNGDLLRATNREVTVLFSDLRGFTRFSEQRDPQEVVGILNEYLGAVPDVLVDADAMIDYLGDGVMAVFGVPTEHADRAVAAGIGVGAHRGMTKDAPYDLLIADATRVLSPAPDDLVEHATLPIRGRAEPVKLWSLQRAASDVTADPGV